MRLLTLQHFGDKVITLQLNPALVASWRKFLQLYFLDAEVSSMTQPEH